jgi:hypothetical protein
LHFIPDFENALLHGKEETFLVMGKKVNTSFIENFSQYTTPRQLNDLYELTEDDLEGI